MACKGQQCNNASPQGKSLRRQEGKAQFEERQEGRRRTLRGIEGGAIKRALFVAERAGRAGVA